MPNIQVVKPARPDAIERVEMLTLPNWWEQLPKIADAWCFTVEEARRCFAEAKLLNTMIALHLNANGFWMEKEQKSKGADGGGYVLRRRTTGAVYKLHIVTKRVDLRPPGNYGMNRYNDPETMRTLQKDTDGYALVFTAEICREPPMPAQDCVYLISHDFVRELVAKGIANSKYVVEKWEPLNTYLREQFGEPTLSSLGQAAVAASLAGKAK